MPIDFAALSRDPDISGSHLLAYDATDELLSLRAAELTRSGARLSGSEVVVIGDRHGALTLSLTLPESLGGCGLRGVRVFQDPLLAERALMRNYERLSPDSTPETAADVAPPFVHHELGAALYKGARLVLMQLPKSLAELTELAYWAATNAHPEVTLIAGGRVKHMTRAQNDVLGRYFTSVEASLAVRKSRLLVASGARDDPADPPFPITREDPDLSFALHAYGATFGGATLDHGSRLMLQHLPDIARGARTIVDLGSGNGVLAVSAALARPDARVTATDQSWAAVTATRATARWAGVGERVTVTRADGCELVEPGSVDLVLVNPPFHSGHLVHEGVAHRLFESAARALAPGGTLAVVFNSHLGHRRVIERVVGPVTQLARDRSFTLVTATKKAE